MDHVVLPDDERLRAIFGLGNPSKKAYRRRLRYAERRGLLPPRRYMSKQRFVYLVAELEGILARLPRDFESA